MGTDVGTILAFPSDAAARRSARIDGSSRNLQGPMGQIVILPVVRIERTGETSGDRGPEEGAAPGRRRRRRARS